MVTKTIQRYCTSKHNICQVDIIAYFDKIFSNLWWEKHGTQYIVVDKK